jgi:predicted ribosomally synthesized peptide with nif11-like leader
LSKENLKLFLEKVSQSEELKARIGRDNEVNTLIDVGAEHGFLFSAEDFEETAELTDDELDQVAGGTAVWGGVANSPGFRLHRGELRKLDPRVYENYVPYNDPKKG